jgi:hypothetical protein
MKLGGHLHENLFPRSTHVAPLLQGEGLHGEPGETVYIKKKNLSKLIKIARYSLTPQLKHQGS